MIRVYTVTPIRRRREEGAMIRAYTVTPRTTPIHVKIHGDSVFASPEARGVQKLSVFAQNKPNKKLEGQKLIFFGRPRTSPLAKILVLMPSTIWDGAQGQGGLRSGSPGGSRTYVLREGGYRRNHPPSPPYSIRFGFNRRAPEGSPALSLPRGEGCVRPELLCPGAKNGRPHLLE